MKRLCYDKPEHERFGSIVVFRLRYCRRAPDRDLYEEYLGAQFDSLGLAATLVGPEVLPTSGGS